MDAAVAGRLVSIFLEVVVAPAFEPDALAILAGKPNLRLVVDPVLADDGPGPRARPDRLDPQRRRRRPRHGARTPSPDDPAGLDRRDPARARPTPSSRDLDLAWRLVRGVTSNAIVLVRDRRLIGHGLGPDVAGRRGPRRRRPGPAPTPAPAALAGAACASDAFYPFADAVEVCLAAGVTAFAQPGGSVRDDEVVAVADAAGATMLMTGTRHFRH